MTVRSNPTTDRQLHVSALVAQLRALEHLTRTEARIARLRTAQARTAAVRRELEQNAAAADRRVARIATALRSLDAVPDVVAPVVGRVLAVAKAVAEQVQPVDEAVLADLLLENELLDRARYARELAGHAGLPDVVALTDSLVDAHSETVEWLNTVLAQEAAGGPRALEPTTLQRIAGGVTRLAGLPARFAVERVNRTVDALTRRGRDAAGRLQGTADGVRTLVSDVQEVAGAGRDAALTRAEDVAERERAGTIADTAHTARARVGALSAGELPIPRYADLTAQNTIAAIRRLDDPDDVRVVAAFEEQHKNRSGVLSAADAQIAALSGSR
ncbi:ferritin-like domain-containing protein [Pseudonocardia sp. CA-107938]|uniref:ferritin-like domain-containing protein n=1 Tax=Pseudonocardia sp. CA-107938 TaxID=3240021 RepID=UPI003D8FF95E